MAVLTWSHNRIAQLKKLWHAGLSASQIAAELGNVLRSKTASAHTLKSPLEASDVFR
jgi:hypothetical protein